MPGRCRVSWETNGVLNTFKELNASYELEEPCEFIYRIGEVTKVVDGDTVDCVFDLGFDVMFHGRVELLGIDTPESRTRHKNEKVYGEIE